MHTLGSLTVVGPGICLGSHITNETLVTIQNAEKVLINVYDPLMQTWLEHINPNTESLQQFYSFSKERSTSYEEMTDYILSYLYQGLKVCAVFYGHPGVFARSGHESIRRAQAEGYSTRMLPAVSSEDCLFADLGIDPSDCGCQSFEATDFLVYDRKFDPTSSLILWQIAMIGETKAINEVNTTNLFILVEMLQKSYISSHKVALYEAAQYPICDPLIQWVNLENVPYSQVTQLSTLYIPPNALASLDIIMVRRLGISLPKEDGNNAEATK